MIVTDQYFQVAVHSFLAFLGQFKPTNRFQRESSQPLDSRNGTPKNRDFKRQCIAYKSQLKKAALQGMHLAW